VKGLIIKRFLFHWIILFIILSLGKAWSYSENDCIGCHKLGSQQSKLNINMDDYLSSIHGKEITCMDCHQTVKDEYHVKIKGSAKVNCQKCHEQKNLHSRDGSVSCDDCHTSHNIYSAEDSLSSVYWKNMKNTCAKCHPNESNNPGVLSFLPSLHIASHPKQTFAKAFDKGMCIGCHQAKAAHGEDFPINHQDCYKCHIPLGKKSALLGYIHTNASWNRQLVSFIAGYTYLIALIAFGFLLVRGILAFKKGRHQ